MIGQIVVYRTLIRRPSVAGMRDAAPDEGEVDGIHELVRLSGVLAEVVLE